MTSCCGAPLVGVRCTGCGHRQSVDQKAPCQTRDQPWWTWPLELVGRWLARRLGR